MVLFALLPAQSASIERYVRSMGTDLQVSVEAPDRSLALAASEAALAALLDAEERLSTWAPGSELSLVNASPPGAEFRLSPRLARDLAAALACSEATGGAFAPGIGALVRAWDLRGGGRRPSSSEIEDARASAAAENVGLEGERLVRRSERYVFEEGGFGKGAGLDDAMEALSRTEASGAVLNLGGQVAVWGKAQADVVIADPRRRDRAVLQLTVSRGSVATSGNSERGIVVGDRRLGHVLDPRTGRPSPDFGSVTVWAQDALTADCLSTGLYVLGPEAALRWAAGRDDVAVVVVRVNGNQLEAIASSSLGDRLTPLVDDLALAFSSF